MRTIRTKEIVNIFAKEMNTKNCGYSIRSTSVLDIIAEERQLRPLITSKNILYLNITGFASRVMQKTVGDIITNYLREITGLELSFEVYEIPIKYRVTYKLIVFEHLSNKKPIFQVFIEPFNIDYDNNPMYIENKEGEEKYYLSSLEGVIIDKIVNIKDCIENIKLKTTASYRMRESFKPIITSDIIDLSYVYTFLFDDIDKKIIFEKLREHEINSSDIIIFNKDIFEFLKEGIPFTFANMASIEEYHHDMSNFIAEIDDILKPSGTLSTHLETSMKSSLVMDEDGISREAYHVLGTDNTYIESGTMRMFKGYKL